MRRKQKATLHHVVCNDYAGTRVIAGTGSLGTSQAIKLFLSLQKTNLKKNRCVDAFRYAFN